MKHETLVEELLYWHENAEDYSVKDLEKMTFRAAERIEELERYVRAGKLWVLDDTADAATADGDNEVKP